MKRLIYLPLEPYVERYTYLMSSKDGWTVDNLEKNNIEFKMIEGKQLGDTIKTGKVLDAHGRSYYALSQMMEVVRMLSEGEITENDTIYFEDFWHPGIESLFYIRQMSGVDFKLGTFLHAQSVDNSDFSYEMKDWMRPIEKGFGKEIDDIFVTSKILKSLCIEAGIGTNENIHVVGLPYNSKRLLEQVAEMGITDFTKEDYVLFSSRFDDEKDPMFFLDLVERCKDIKFKLVKPRAVLSHNPLVMHRVMELLESQNNFEVVDTSNKKDYYELLAAAKVQFNCAHQDWVSWTLLEAVTFQANPLYPKWKDFPLELKYDERYLYKKQNLDDCENKLRELMKKPFDPQLMHIKEKHDDSWRQYLDKMGFEVDANV